MNKEEFLGKLQMCYFGERNAFDEIVQEFDKLNNIIKEYENKGYDIAQERADFMLEIQRLNNIINEFDKWLLGEKMMFYKSGDGERLIRFGETTNKWLELKEGR